MKKFLFAVLAYSVSAITLFSAPSMAAQEAERQHFVLLRPDLDHPFWELYQSAMKSACEDIGCDVEVKFAEWDHFKMIEQAKELGTLEKKPDAVFFQSYKQNGPALIKVLNDAGINAFLVNAGLTSEQAKETGIPREKYSHWIGQIMPDDEGAGASTAEALYREAKKRGYAKDGKIYFVGIEGNSADGASIERLKGLNRVVESHEDLELIQVVQGKWQTELSHKLALSLIERYPDIHVIWAAGDPVAFGVLDATREKGLPDGTILTAGVDWAPRALEEVKSGAMVGSAGGHFMEGAWSAILMYDYLQGKDFKEIAGVEMKSSMGFLNSENLSVYTKKFGEGNFSKVDFREFSRHYHPELKKYTFDISPLLEQ